MVWLDYGEPLSQYGRSFVNRSNVLILSTSVKLMNKENTAVVFVVVL